MSLNVFRNQIAGTNISQIVSDTRFIPESGLINCIDSLLKVVMATEDEVVCDFLQPDEEGLVPLLMKMSSARSKAVLNITSSSIAWMEMMLVDISLRNRDRFSSIWPSLQRHYSTSLHRDRGFQLSYVAERFDFIIYNN